MRSRGGILHLEWIGKFDGNDYPVQGVEVVLTSAYRRVDDRTWELRQKIDGEPVATVRFTTLTALRFTTALPALVVLLLVAGGPTAFANYSWSDTPLYLAIALIPGLFPMLLYYRGLASTLASLATLAELAFPITGILVNLLFVTPPQSVSTWQLAGIVVLTGSLIALDYTNAKRPAKLERGAEVALT